MLYRGFEMSYQKYKAKIIYEFALLILSISAIGFIGANLAVWL